MEAMQYVLYILQMEPTRNGELLETEEQKFFTASVV